MGFSGGGGGVSQEQAATINIVPNMILQEAIFRQKGVYVGYDNLFTDLMTSAGGANGTVNTTASTAIFNTNLYSNVANQSNGQTMTSATFTGWIGQAITPSQDISILSINKYNGVTASNGAVWDSSGNVLASGTFSGNTCTLSSPLTLTSGTQYFILLDCTGTHYRQTSGTTPPVANTYLSWTDGSVTGATVGSGSTWYDIASVDVVPSTVLILESKAQSIPTNTLNPNYFLVYANNTTTGTSAIKCDVSFDGGSTFMTNVSINEPVSITSTNTNSIVLKWSLEPGTSYSKATIDAYGCDWW